jgi:hypothetical protein
LPIFLEGVLYSMFSCHQEAFELGRILMDTQS